MFDRKYISRTVLIVVLSVAASAIVAYWVGKFVSGRQLAAQVDLLDRERAIFRDYASRVVNLNEYRLGYGPSRLSTPCIDSSIELFRETDGDVDKVISKCGRSLVDRIPMVSSKISENDIRALFIMIIVNRLAPYGFSSETDPHKILTEPMLNCAQHSIMISYLISQHVSGVKILERIGLDGGAVGNHALVYYESDTAKMILDGTTAMVTFVDIDDVFAGKIVSVYEMYDFFSSTDEHLEIFRRNLRGAYRLGAIRPQHVIYRENVLESGF